MLSNTTTTATKSTTIATKYKEKTYRKHVVTSYIQQMHKHQYDDNVDEEELRILSQKKSRQTRSRLVLVLDLV